MTDKVLVDTTQEEEDEKVFRVVANKEESFTYTQEEHGFDLVVKYKLPTLKQKDTAAMLYSKTYNRLLQDSDHLTVKELLETAVKRNMWTEADSERLTTIDDDIIETRDAYNEETAPKKKDKLETKLASLREEKFRLALRVSNLTSTALEVLAERERTIYMLKNCVLQVDEEGNETPLYATKEDIENETNMKKLERILMEGKSFWSGEGLSDFLHLGD